MRIHLVMQTHKSQPWMPSDSARPELLQSAWLRGFGLRWLCDLAPDEFPHQNTVARTVADFRVSVDNGQLLETGITA